MHLRTVLLTLMPLFLTVPRINSLDATICDCSNVKDVGLLDTSLPSYCDHHRTIETPKEARYEIWTRPQTSATGKAYTCQKWTEEKHVTGYFPHTFDTTFRTVTEMVTADACWMLVTPNVVETTKCLKQPEDGATQPHQKEKGFSYQKRRTPPKTVTLWRFP